jgi:hypothetical protein
MKLNDLRAVLNESDLVEEIPPNWPNPYNTPPLQMPWYDPTHTTKKWWWSPTNPPPNTPVGPGTPWTPVGGHGPLYQVFDLIGPPPNPPIRVPSYVDGNGRYVLPPNFDPQNPSTWRNHPDHPGYNDPNYSDENDDEQGPGPALKPDAIPTWYQEGNGVWLDPDGNPIRWEVPGGGEVEGDGGGSSTPDWWPGGLGIPGFRPGPRGIPILTP